MSPVKIKIKIPKNKNHWNNKYYSYQQLKSEKVQKKIKVKIRISSFMGLKW